MTIQTFVLIIQMSVYSSVAVGGYGSAAECEAARAVTAKALSATARGVSLVAPFCIPGPVESR